MKRELVTWLSAERENKALKASFSASSVRSPRTSKVEIETQPNCPLADKTSLVKVERTHIYHPGNAGDQSNGTRWMAETNDDHPWLMVDLGVFCSQSLTDG